jgi:hypothetical protein
LTSSNAWYINCFSGNPDRTVKFPPGYPNQLCKKKIGLVWPGRPLISIWTTKSRATGTPRVLIVLLQSLLLRRLTRRLPHLGSNILVSHRLDRRTHQSLASLLLNPDCIKFPTDPSILVVEACINCVVSFLFGFYFCRVRCFFSIRQTLCFYFS